MTAAKLAESRKQKEAKLEAEINEVMDKEKKVEKIASKGVKFEPVRHELIKRACRRHEKANLNFKSKSLGWSSMLDCVYGEYCEEIRLGEGIALMRLGWREFIRTL